MIRFVYLEAITNTAVSFVFNFLINMFLLPLFGLNLDVNQNIGLALAFALLAVVKNYLVRRFFDRFEWKKMFKTKSEKLVDVWKKLDERHEILE